MLNISDNHIDILNNLFNLLSNILLFFLKYFIPYIYCKISIILNVDLNKYFISAFLIVKIISYITVHDIKPNTKILYKYFNLFDLFIAFTYKI